MLGDESNEWEEEVYADDADEGAAPSRLRMATKRENKAAQKRKREGGADNGMPRSKHQKDAKKSAGALTSSRSMQKAMQKNALGKRSIKKGRGVVDINSGLSERGHILEEGATVWQCKLNQTNIGQNNNKFYVIEVIEADSGGRWWTWNRWGRVGATGQGKLQEFHTKEQAKADFSSKFRQKTLNNWADRENFKKHPFKYQLMDIDYGDNADVEGADDNDWLESERPCKLDPRVRRLMHLISNERNMTAVMKELDIDIKRMPLGKISKRQIRDAGAQLKRIEDVLRTGKARGTDQTVLQASSQFYTLIPHDIGFKSTTQALKPISSMKELDEKRQMLDALSDLELSARVLANAKAKQRGNEHPLDAAYKALGTRVTPLPQLSGERKLIEEAVRTTHGKTHNAYKLEVCDVFELHQDREAARFAGHSKEPGRAMLWHGSRTTNFMGILSQGLRIAPPEAPSTGYMFGKGVYFADCASKSANYCHCKKAMEEEGLLLLCEVALGDPAERLQAEYMEQPPAGKDSVFGVGRFTPSRPDFRPGTSDGDSGPGGARWPLGPMDDVSQQVKGLNLLYNEYIVYDVSRIRARYAVRVRFNYK